MGDIRHFIITLVVLVGGPWLATIQPDFKDFVLASCTTILGVWFGARASNGAPRP